jgi:hypothetical protein
MWMKQPHQETTIMNSRTASRLAISIMAVLLGFPTLALAGPPLVCHSLNIGNAKSLPSVELSYRKGSTNYDLQNLTRDTLAILDSGAPVIVRMETLRRATIYARQDSQVAKELVTRLQARASNSDEAGHPDALAWFDFGYLIESYKQWTREGQANPVAGLDGYGLVRKAIGLRGSDPEMEFGAALITLAGPEKAHQEHVQRAMAGAKNDPLLAQNLVLAQNVLAQNPASHLGGQKPSAL